MKHIKTFEGYLNESHNVNEFQNDFQDLEKFINDLRTEVEKAAGYLYFDEDSGEVGAVSRTKLSDPQIKTMFDSGKPADGDTYMFYMENGNIDNVSQEAIEKALKATGLTDVDLKKLVKIHESVINESNEDAEDLAEDWHAEVMDADDAKTTAGKAMDSLLSSWISSAVSKMGANDKFYLITKNMVEDNDGLKAAGLEWPLFLKLVKDVKYEETKIDGDHVILFCEK